MVVILIFFLSAKFDKFIMRSARAKRTSRYSLARVRTLVGPLQERVNSC